MPGSYNYFKSEVKQHLLENFSKDTKFLDVGPGYGTYAKLLRPEFQNIDAVEIWEKYVDQFKLNELYNRIFISNIIGFDFSKYDYLIIGDVLEHLITTDAQDLLQKINDTSKKCLIAVPYQYPQGQHEGNTYETHLQPDLTPEIVLERYPQLILLYKNDVYGYYINYEPLS